MVCTSRVGNSKLELNFELETRAIIFELFEFFELTLNAPEGSTRHKSIRNNFQKIEFYFPWINETSIGCLEIAT